MLEVKETYVYLKSRVTLTGPDQERICKPYSLLANQTAVGYLQEDTGSKITQQLNCINVPITIDPDV